MASKPGFITRQGASNFYLRQSGMGGFLNPPGNAEHLYSISEERGGHEVGSYSLGAAAQSDWLPATVRMRAQRKLEQRPGESSEQWIQSVYNYFRGCYSPDGIDRNASKCIIPKGDHAMPNEWHLAVLHIRQWFPDHEVRVDLIANNGPLGAWSKSK